MLTGEILPTEGSASLHDRHVTKSKSRRLVGYCPQMNSLDTLLTGRQTLHIYAQLKNIDNADQVLVFIHLPMCQGCIGEHVMSMVMSIMLCLFLSKCLFLQARSDSGSVLSKYFTCRLYNFFEIVMFYCSDSLHL